MGTVPTARRVGLVVVASLLACLIVTVGIPGEPVPTVSAAYNAGKLPWPCGVRMRTTQDRQNRGGSHDPDKPDGWAWDFGNGTSQWPIAASKSGVAKVVYLATPDGTTGDWRLANRIVIDNGDNTAQVYIHLSGNKGSPIHAGDYVTAGTVIGYADQTGRSDAPHLHFAIQQWNSSWNVATASSGDNWYQPSIESLFDDPNVSGGNPKYPNWYTSGNCSGGTRLVGDIYPINSGDGKVNSFDYGVLVRQYNQTGSNLLADLNRDGKVNAFDWAMMRRCWWSLPSWPPECFSGSRPARSGKVEPAGVEESQNSQSGSGSDAERKPRSQGRGRLWVSPGSGKLQPGTRFQVDVSLDTGGRDTAGTDAVLRYDPSKLKLVSIERGQLYPEYTIAHDASGLIAISGLAEAGTGFSGSGVLARINFAVMPDAPPSSTRLTFDFDPRKVQKTTDSNIVSGNTATSYDTLRSARGGNYRIVQAKTRPSQSKVSSGLP